MLVIHALNGTLWINSGLAKTFLVIIVYITFVIIYKQRMYIGAHNSVHNIEENEKKLIHTIVLTWKITRSVARTK